MTDAGFDAVVQAHALVLLVGLPVLATRAGLRESQQEQVKASRLAVYLSAALSMALIAGLTLGVAWWRGVPALTLGWRVGRPEAALLWAAGATVVGLLLVWIISRAGALLGLEESGLAQALIPRGSTETLAFVLLSLAAALGEEYIYRGFVLHVLAGWWGSPWLAVAATALSFGVAHGYQRSVGVMRAVALGVVLAVPVLRLGSLFPAVAAHFWINAVIGVGGWKLLYEEGAGTPRT